MPRFFKDNSSGFLKLPSTGNFCGASTISSASLSPGSGSFSIAFSFKADIRPSRNNGTSTILECPNGSYTSGWFVNHYQNNIAFYVKSGGGQIVYPIQDFSWHRYVLVANASNGYLYLYVDGNLITSVNNGSWGTITSPVVFSAGTVATNEFYSAIGSLKKISYAVGTAWSLQDVLNDLSGDLPSSVTHAWSLDDFFGTVARATVGGIPLTLSGGASFGYNYSSLNQTSSINLLPQSARVYGTYWTYTNLTATLNQSDPFGGNEATLLTESSDGSSTSHLIFQNQNTNIGELRIVSAYFKPSTRNFAVIAPDAGGVVVIFDLINLTTYLYNNSGNYISSGCEAASNGFIRCWVLYKVAYLNYEIRFYATNTFNNVNYQGNGSAALTIYGAMCEFASYGQTTPSQFINAYKSGVSGDNKQNLAGYSENLNQISASTSGQWDNNGGGTSVTTGITDPLNGTTACTLTWVNQARDTWFLQWCTNSTLPGNTYTVTLWAKTSDNTNKTITFTGWDNINTWMGSNKNITGSWQKINFNIIFSSSSTLRAFGIRNVPSTGIDIAFVQLNQSNIISNYIKTTSAIYDLNNYPLSVYSIKDTRQNLILWSENQSKSNYSLGGGSLSSGISDPFGGTSAFSYTFSATTGQAAWLLQSINNIDSTSAWTFSVWLKSPSSNITAVSLAMSDLFYGYAPSSGTSIIITNTWKRFSITVDRNILKGNSIGVGLLGGGTTSTVHVFGYQLTNNTFSYPPDYVKTTSAPYNPNGPPKTII